LLPAAPQLLSSPLSVMLGPVAPIEPSLMLAEALTS
jgi:hypothetical protein